MKYMLFVLFCFVRTEEYIDFHYAIWLSLLLTFDFVVCLFVCFLGRFSSFFFGLLRTSWSLDVPRILT